MKNKKSLLSLVLLALVLILGVGYAVVSSVGLTIGGSAGVKNAELKVDIASVKDTKTGESTISHTLTAHTKEDTFTISNMSLNETVTMVYTIDNHETDVAATIAEKVALTNSNTDYFTANYTIDNANVPAGGQTTVTVVVTLKKTPVTEAQGTANISFSVQADPVNNG